MAVGKDKELQQLEAENIEVDTTEPSKDEQEAEIEQFQGSVFDALLAAASYETDEDETYTLRIIRPIGGKDVELFRFRIHPLSEEKINAIRKKNTKVKRDRRYGIDREKVDSVRFRSQLIYEATVPADRDKIWNDKQAWEKLNVLNGIDLIDRVLKAGEKDKIVETIETVSGYGTEEDVGVLVKN